MNTWKENYIWVITADTIMMNENTSFPTLIIRSPKFGYGTLTKLDYEWYEYT